jgi:hypothetical protein
MNDGSDRIMGESEAKMSTVDALTALIRTRDLTPQIAEGLALNPAAVETFHDLPDETKTGMVDALIDRVSNQLGGSWA